MGVEGTHVRIAERAARSTAWTAVTYTNSWVDHASNQPVQYRKEGDVVRVRGTMKNGTLAASAFTLPAGFRPPVTFTVGLCSWNGATPSATYCAVGSGGTVIPYGGVNTEVAVEFSFSTST